MKELDILISGDPQLRAPQPSVRDTLRAVWRAHRILAVYDQRGEPAALRALGSLPMRNRPPYTRPEAVLAARHLSATVQRFLRLRYPGALCLPRAIAVCAALRSAGFPTQVVIGRRAVRSGRQRFSNTPQDYEFHAWAELEEDVLTDAPVHKLGHVELARVPSN